MTLVNKLGTKEKFHSFTERLLKKLDEGKAFTIRFNNEPLKVSRMEINEVKSKLKNPQGGFLPLLMPLLSGLFTRGSGFSLEEDEETKEKSGGFLGALMAGASKIVPYILKALPFLTGGTEIASNIAKTVNESKKAGSGFYLNQYQGRGLRDFIKNTVDDPVLNQVIKGFKNGINIETKDNKIILSANQ